MNWIEFQIKELEFYQGKQFKQVDRQAIVENLEETYPKSVLKELNKISISFYPTSKKGSTSFSLYVGDDLRLGSASYMDLINRIHELEHLIIVEQLNYENAVKKLHAKYNNHNIAKGKLVARIKRTKDEDRAKCEELGINYEDI